MASTPVVKVAVYGDDEVEGLSIGAFGMPTLVTPNEESDLQTALQAQYSDSGISVTNDATGGLASSLPNELDGMDGGGVAEPQRMAQSGAQIAIEEHALNEGYDGETPDVYGAYLTQWVQDAQSAGLTPVLEEPSPTCDTDHPQLAQYVAAMDAVAVKLNVPIVRNYAFVQGIAGWQSHMLGCTVPDSYLDGLKAQQEMTVLQPIVQSLMK